MMLTLTTVCLLHIVSLNPTIYQVEIKVYQKLVARGNDQVREKVLASPVLTTNEDIFARIAIGGEEPVPHTNPARHLPVGMSILIKLQPRSDNNCFLDMAFENLARTRDSEKLLTVAGQTMKSQGIVPLNKKITECLGDPGDEKSIWIDFTIMTIKPN